MKRLGLTLFSIIAITTILVLQPPSQETEAAPLPPPQAGEVNPALELAVQEKFASGEKSIQSLQILDYKIDTMIPSQDGEWALLWLAPFDLQLGETIATEPGFAIAHLIDPANETWQIILPTDAEWSQTLDQLPADLLPGQVEAAFSQPDIQPHAGVQAVYRGYKLPWASGVQRRLSGSISHFLVYNSCNESACRYAYDFADGTMFPLLAARGGTVKTYYDGCYNGDSTCTNYLVLEDQSTSPTTWQIYYHLAKGSIPSSLKSVGTPVAQGQYIGNVDDTGYSSGHHLHFHVTTYLYWWTTYYGQNVPWGWSVDIRFDDVSINDGTPRTCYEASYYPGYGTQCNENNWFTSGNVGTDPPTGSLAQPAAGITVTGPGLTVSGNASDNLGITKVQVIARGLDGIWRDVGPSLSSVPFTTSLDLCSASVPNGPVDIALRIWDMEGNISTGAPGLRTILKNYACAPPPPECKPTADNIVLYAEPNYQGACREYAKDASGSDIRISDLSSDNKVGNDDTASIKVGGNTRAVLFTDNAFGGRSETLEVSDANLADNRIGADTLSSLQVQPRALQKLENIGFTFPANNAVFPSSGSIFAVLKGAGATNFDIRLYRMLSSTTSEPVEAYLNLSQPSVSLGSLPPGNYKLIGRVFNSVASDGVGAVYFSVDNTGLMSISPKSVPFADDMQINSGEWQPTGSWNYADLSGNGSNFGWRFNGYSDPSRPINYGSLTSPPVALPAAGASYLRFSYRAVTESSYPFWDQRRVQISVDGSNFQDIAVVENGGAPHAKQNSPLWDDAQDWWLESPPIDLSAYAGKTVRIRFAFFTADTFANNGEGWQIDNVRIDASPGNNACAESSRNDKLATATAVTIGQSVTGSFVCPQGDVDYYKFNGTAGQRVAFRVDAGIYGSNLDSYLYLLDSSGGLILENDDIDPGVVRDSVLGATLPYTGVYYLKVKAWNHPAAGGPDYFYILTLQSDMTPPAVSIANPINQWLPGSLFEVSANAFDSGGGVSRVDFYWHNPDWQNGTWQLIASDLDGSDGWSAIYDLTTKGNLANSGIYVEAYDAADNSQGALILGMQIDTIKPSSQLSPLAGETRSTAVQLRWSGSDTGSGLSEFNFQYKNGGDWQNWQPNRTAAETSGWFLGQFGQSYEFRLRALDRAGNVEDYPSSAEAVTRIEAACSAASDAYERSGADNTREGAAPLPSETHQEHNLCGLNDVDWVSFTGQAGVKLLIAGVSVSGGAAVSLEVYNSAGELLASVKAPDLGKHAIIAWTPPASETYYLRAAALDPGLAGTDARYTLSGYPAKTLYLPVVGR